MGEVCSRGGGNLALSGASSVGVALSAWQSVREKQAMHVPFDQISLSHCDHVRSDPIGPEAHALSLSHAPGQTEPGEQVCSRCWRRRRHWRLHVAAVKIVGGDSCGKPRCIPLFPLRHRAAGGSTSHRNSAPPRLSCSRPTTVPGIDESCKSVASEQT